MFGNLNEDTTQRVTYSYDNANQFTQNGLGRLSQVSFGGGVADEFSDSYYYLYSYNTAGRVTSQQMAVQAPANGGQANYQWDNEGRMTSLQYPTVSLPDNPPWETSFSLQTAAYQYDINGRMTGTTWDSGNGPQPYASATYGPAGQMLTLSYGAGTETRTYNSLLQLTSQSVPGYLNMTYNYSAGQNNGRIVGSVDGITGENTTYTYDALNRLASATASGMWGYTYSYDGFGNLTGKSGTGGAPSMTASYNAQNQQVGGGAAYDANGNQTSANSTTNVFTVENRIKNQSSQIWPNPVAEFAYDPWGRRVMKRTDPDPNGVDNGSNPSWQYNFYGITGQRLVTLGCTNPSANPLPNCTVQGQNVYYGRKLLVSNGVTVVTDRLGSVRGNTQGERFAYYPYGEERTTTPDGREKFGTYFRDGVGQDYARARYYGSGTGRFWSPDPTTDSVDYPDPTSWNAYAYVNGDPINFNDPTGLQVSIPIDDGGSPDSCLNQKLIPWMQQNGFAVTGDLGSLFNTPTGVLGLTLYYEDTTGSQALYTDMAQVMLNRYYIQMSNGKLAGQLGIASGSFTSVVESSSNVWSGGSLLSADYNDLINVLNGDVVSRQSAVNAAACSELISALNASLAAQSYVGKSVLLPGSTVSTATYWFFLPGSDPVAHQYWLTKTSGPIDGFLFETLIGPRAPLPRKKRPRRPAHGEGDF